jgi:ABC-type transport system involved in multi-copper enzyme maturation permease subunit
MVGPVLNQEMLLGGRRNRLHVLRWLYAGLLIVELLGLYGYFYSEEWARAANAMRMSGTYNEISAPEVVGERFAVLFVRQQMIILLLITPAFVAGAITDEKRSGTLQYLALTDLESRHIILGKLIARLAQVALVMLAGLPLFALMAGFGGIPPVSMLFSLLVLLMPMFGLSAATLLTSVYCKQTRDAVLALYVVFVVVGLVVYLVGGWLMYLDPIHVLSPAWGPPGSLDLNEAGRRLAIAAAVWGGVGSLCVVAAAARLRPVYIRELQSLRPEQTAWYHAGRDAVSDEPVHWRESQVEGLAPNAALRRVPQWLAITLIASATTLSSLGVLWWALDRKATVADVVRATMELNVRKVATLLPGAAEGFWIQGIVVTLLASLVVGIRCSGSIATEREKATWEAVLLTPMTAKQIVRGKLWGVMGASVWYLLAYAAPALSLSAFGGPLALFYTVMWFGVTVLAMYFIGAAGLWCSVKARDSWRSLLHTMGLGYLGGLVLYLVLTPAFAILAGLLLLMIVLMDFVLKTNLASLCWNKHFYRVFFISSCLGLVVAFWLLAALFVSRTVRWIADRDRTRHWHDEPLYRRSRLPDMVVRRQI